MKNKLIIVEGIPGSGKTTIASKIKDYIESKGEKVRLYKEGDNHPVDLAWIACLNLDEYRKVLVDFPDSNESINKIVTVDGEYAYIPYTKLTFNDTNQELLKYLESKEIYDGRVSIETFKKIHMTRWEQFAKVQSSKDEIVIFECAYLQNHVNELVAFSDKSKQYVVDYLIDLINSVKNLNPKIIYLSQPNIKETITRVADERIFSNGDKWIDFVIKYVENSYYGKKYDLNGFQGVIDFLSRRKEIELEVLKYLPIDVALIENLDYDWNKITQQVYLNL